MALLMCVAGCDDDEQMIPHTGRGLSLEHRILADSRTTAAIPKPIRGTGEMEGKYMVYNSVEELQRDFGEEVTEQVPELERIDFGRSSLVVFMYATTKPNDKLQVNFLEKFDGEAYCIDLSYFGVEGAEPVEQYTQMIALVTTYDRIASDAKIIYHLHTY